VRHLFDQYEKWENRITHALVSCLDQDRTLLREFTKWILGEKIKRRQDVCVIEQSYPEGEELDEKGFEARRKKGRGLPDACIYEKALNSPKYEDNKWVLIVENKIKAPFMHDQLKRHRKTISDYGFRKIYLLVIMLYADKGKLSEGRGVKLKTWDEIYEWMYQNALNHSRRTKWAKLFIEYLEIAESRMIHVDYLPKGGHLTKYSGIPFDSDKNPYNYGRARSILSQLMQKLGSDKKFREIMGIKEKPSRGAITGSKSFLVWNAFAFKKKKLKDVHLTVLISHECLELWVTFTYKLKVALRKKLLCNDIKNDKDGTKAKEDFLKFINIIIEKMEKATGPDDAVMPMINVHQLRYPHQNSSPYKDAVIICDLRTVKGEKKGPKCQPETVESIHTIMSGPKKSHLQLEIGAKIFYKESKSIKKSKSAEVIKNVFKALMPCVDKLAD
jgi:hypothetical protein